jgi:SAM-dependent methyltransferase
MTTNEPYLYTVGNRIYTKKTRRPCRENIVEFLNLALPLITAENYTAVVTGRVLYDIANTYDFDFWLMGPIADYKKLEQLILNLYDIANNLAGLWVDIKWSAVSWSMYYDPITGQVLNKDAENISISYCEVKNPKGNSWLSDRRIEPNYTPITEWLVKTNFKDTPVEKFKPNQIEFVKKYGNIRSVLVEEFLQNLDHYLAPIEKPLPKFDFDPDSRYLQRHNKNLYNIFSEGIDIDYSQSKILDFGCNQGNYIYNANNIVSPSQYIGIDLNFPSIEAAKIKHPEYRFVHYNKWHPSYNPYGNKSIKLTDFVDTDFDVVIAYSVLTHTSINETKKILDELYQVIKPGGTILFTIWLTEHFYNFYNCIKHMQKNIILDAYTMPKCDTVMYWTDYRNIIVDIDDLYDNIYGSLCTFYQKNSFEKLFPNTKFIKKVTDGATQWLYRIDKPLTLTLR